MKEAFIAASIKQLESLTNRYILTTKVLIIYDDKLRLLMTLVIHWAPRERAVIIRHKPRDF